MTQAPSILWLHPPLGPWSPLHSGGGWIKTMKVHPLLNLLDPDMIYTTTAPILLARTSPVASTTCNKRHAIPGRQLLPINDSTP